jgi:hypothetical protein
VGNPEPEPTGKECSICLASYDRGTRLPLIICSNHHTICQDCLLRLRDRADCPFCRQRIEILKVDVNDEIYDQLPQLPASPNQRQ